MPVTTELAPLLVPMLADHGIPDPVEFLSTHEEEAWQLAKANAGEFKDRFAGWCAKSVPSPQHYAVSDMLHSGSLSHIISLNWDDLIERAYVERFDEPSRRRVTAKTWRAQGTCGSSTVM